MFLKKEKNTLQRPKVFLIKCIPLTNLRSRKKTPAIPKLRHINPKRYLFFLLNIFFNFIVYTPHECIVNIHK